MARAHPLDPDARRAQLLAAARRVFAERGYHQAGVSDIIDAAGVARGTFYNYFESKRAIFQAVLEEMIGAVAAAVEPIDVTRPIPPQVRADIQRIVDVLQDLGDQTRILFTDAAGIDAEGVEALNAFYGAAAERLERALSTGQRLGIVRDGDVGLLTLCLIGMLREPVYQAVLRRERIDAERLVDEIFAILTGGILRR